MTTNRPPPELTSTGTEERSKLTAADSLSNLASDPVTRRSVVRKMDEFDNRLISSGSQSWNQHRQQVALSVMGTTRVVLSVEEHKKLEGRARSGRLRA